MLSRILVPLDGTPTGEAALPYAEALAKRSAASLVLIHAVHAHGQHDLAAGQLHALEAGEAYLESVAAQLKQRGVAAEIGMPYGAAETWIAEEIGLRNVELVVMATHDRGRPARWLHPSIAEAVVGQAGVPVLVTRADARLTAERFAQTRPVLLVPLDGSDLAEAALPVATELATWLGARLVLLRVAQASTMVLPFEAGVPPFPDQTIEQIAFDAGAYLKQIASRLPAEFAVETVVRRGEPAAEISAAAEAYQAASVVMATHGRTGVLRSLLGSVAGGVVHRGCAPVFLVRPHAAPRTATQSQKKVLAAV
jgi:nucleotide-binding universal stress UspA family protein